MSNRTSHVMHLALKAWEAPKDESQSQAIAKLAVKHGVSAAGLYRALLAEGRISKRPPKADSPQA